jgi:hypothetical protein
MINTITLNDNTISLNDNNDMAQTEFDFSDITISDSITLDSNVLDTITISGPSSSIINNNIYSIGPNTVSGGYIYTTDGTGGDWRNSQNTLQVQGDANFEGDIKIKGKSLNESLEKIEEKLAILYPNEELEEKWDKLRDLRKQYIALEKEIMDKEKVWDILKK